MKTYHIFLASSLRDGLEDDRVAIGNLVRIINDEIEQCDMTISLFKCEYSDDACNGIPKQEEYDRNIPPSDLFFALFNTLKGAFTINEFNIAKKCRKQAGKPQIMVGFKCKESLKDFKAECEAENIQTFDYDEQSQMKWAFLQKVLKDLGQLDLLKVDQGWVLLGEKRLWRENKTML